MKQQIHYNERTTQQTLPSSYWYAMSRYDFAFRNLPQQLVLDMGCGEGLGTAYLITKGSPWAIGADNHYQSLQHASNTYRELNCAFVKVVGNKLPLATDSMPGICCLEVIEHIENDDAFIAELSRILEPNGTLVISTPNKLMTSPDSEKPYNPYHIREYTPNDFETILSKYFANIVLMGQQESQSIARYRESTQQVNQVIYSGVVQMLKKLISHNLRQKIRRKLYEWWSREPVKNFDADEFIFSQEQIETSEVLIAVCNKPI